MPLETTRRQSYLFKLDKLTKAFLDGTMSKAKYDKDREALANRYLKGEKLDPLKVRKGLTTKPKVLGYSDYKCSGLVRILHRVDDEFPEFALYPSRKTIIFESLQQAGFKEEAKGKWVLRTNKFNIFVYV